MAIPWDRVRPLVARLLELPAPEHEAWLAQACNDADLKHLVRRLHAEERADDGFLECPTGPAPADRAGPGARIGPYRLLRELGQGGMGTVWLAEREDGFRQEVALKLIKLGMDTAAVVRRFQRERQLLADLDHPGIVRLFDGGATEDGRPYLVLERVDGLPLSTYCRTHAPDLDARLALFERLCEAVAAAHARGIVHRDLKPSNVLVTAVGEVKVLDFGIAKVLSEDGPEASLLTRTGERLLTPRYAAPEQVRGEPCTPATDVYALGVILYELLCGRSPYDLESSTLREIETAVCEETPARPSTRAEATVRRRLRGDLDVLVMRALSKEPARRYRDAGQLARDVHRHRTHQPIRARPDSLVYRTRKYVRRNRVLLGAAAGIVAALGIGLLATYGQYREAEGQRGLAEERARDAEWAAYVASVRTEFARLERWGSASPFEASDEHKGWEWRHLMARADVSRGLFHQRESGSTPLFLDGAGDRLGLLDGDEVVLLDARTGATRQRVETGPVSLPALSSDGAHLAFVREGVLTVRGLDGGRESAAWPLVEDVRQIEWVPDQPRFAVALKGGVVLLSPETPGWREELVEGLAQDLAFSRSGRLLVVGRTRGMVEVRALDGSGRRWSFRLEENAEDAVEQVAISTSERYVAGASADGVVRVWDLEQGRPLILPLHTRRFCKGLAFDGARDALLVPGACLTILDLGTGRMTQLSGVQGTIRTLAAHPTEPLAYTSASDGRVLSWATDSQPVPRHHLVDGYCRDLSVSPDGERCAVTLGYGPNSVVIVDRETGEVLATHDLSLGWLKDVSYAPDGNVVVAGPSGVTVLDGGDLSNLVELPIGARGSCLAWSPDGGTLYAGTYDQRVLAVSTRDWTVVRTWPIPVVARALAVHPDGARLSAVSQDSAGTVRDLDLATGVWAERAPLGDGALSVAVDAGGRWLAIGGVERMQVRERASDGLLHERPSGQVKGIAFTAQGERLLSVSNSSLRVQDTRTWVELVALGDAERGIQDLAIAGDGTALTCDWAGDLRVFRVR